MIIDSLTRKAICTGVVLIMVSNVIYLLNNYFVSWFELNATEVALVRGLLQVFVFGLVLLLKTRRQL